jgi:aspartyl-tRNA(Asn)/glutamyl-tRNA(Gln) amidotransferase subunit C
MVIMKSSAVTPDVVKKVAKLANLTILPGQQQKFSQQLTSVIGYVSKIQELDTENVPETSQVTGMTNVFREDTVEENRMLSQEEALSGAKKKYKGYFVVPAIFEE